MGKGLIVSTLLLVVACSGTAGDDRESPSADDAPSRAATGGGSGEAARPSVPADATVRLARLPESREGDLAALEGTLQADGPCLYLEAAGSDRYLIAFTIPGVRWDADRRVLVVPPESPGPGAATYPTGERVILGGSEASAATLEDLWVEPPDPACDTGRIWVAHALSSLG
jgi:hypothetical protein